MIVLLLLSNNDKNLKWQDQYIICSTALKELKYPFKYVKLITLSQVYGKWN